MVCFFFTPSSQRKAWHTYSSELCRLLYIQKHMNHVLKRRKKTGWVALTASSLKEHQKKLFIQQNYVYKAHLALQMKHNIVREQ